jgi:hypothetical protein
VALQARPAAKGRKAAAAAQRRAMLFTHRGFSGPAVLDLSHHAVMAAERSREPPGQRAQSCELCAKGSQTFVSHRHCCVYQQIGVAAN